MTIASLQGQPVTHARVQLPAWGVWYADCRLAEEAELAGAVELEIADMKLSGTIVSGGPSKGESRYRVAGGAAAWGHTIKERGYANDVGVKLSSVLADAATEAGERLDVATVPSSSVGAIFTRERGPAARVLQQLATENWYVGEDGVTRLGRRPRAELKVEAARGDFDVSRGTLELAADSIATIVPGVVVDGIEAVDVQHELDSKKLRSTVWGPFLSHSNRHLTALERIIRQLLPDYRYRGGPYEFRLVTQDGERANLQPVRASLGLPDLSRVRIRPGLPGCRATLTLGTVVLVQFVNSDPSRPVVVGFEDAEGPAFATALLELGAGVGPTLGVARQTDAVQAGPFSGVIVGGSVRVRSGL